MLYVSNQVTPPSLFILHIFFFEGFDIHKLNTSRQFSFRPEALLEDAFDVRNALWLLCAISLSQSSYIIPVFTFSSFFFSSFKVESFLNECRRRVQINELQADLADYYSSLKTAMVALINKDYGDFVSLSSNLVCTIHHAHVCVCA